MGNFRFLFPFRFFAIPFFGRFPSWLQQSSHQHMSIADPFTPLFHFLYFFPDWTLMFGVCLLRLFNFVCFHLINIGVRVWRRGTKTKYSIVNGMLQWGHDVWDADAVPWQQPSFFIHNIHCIIFAGVVLFISFFIYEQKTLQKLWSIDSSIDRASQFLSNTVQPKNSMCACYRIRDFLIDTEFRVFPLLIFFFLVMFQSLLFCWSSVWFCPSLTG